MSAGPVTLDAVLRLRALATPDEPVLLYTRRPLARRSVSWAALDRWADQVARELHGLGFVPGARCALPLRDEPACLASMYGALRASGVVIPIDLAWGDAAIENVLRHADVDWIVGGKQDLQSRAVFANSLPPRRVVRFAALREGAVAPVDPKHGPEDLALIAFTSGTTSGPKGVMLTHRNLRAAYTAAHRHLDLGARRRFGCAFRLSGLGILGMNYLFAHECGAATVVLPELTPATAPGFWANVQRERIDFLYLVPPVVRALNRLARRPADRHPALLVVSSAAPISQAAMEEFQDRFDVPLRNVYGLTEASFAVFFGVLDCAGRGTVSIGPARSLEARIVDRNDRPIEGPAEGQLEIRGPTVSMGYWKNSRATAEIFHDGWLRTGDVAFRDGAGFFFIRGRSKEVVIRGGFSIHLAEVDEALLAHPSVLEAAAVPVEDRLYGEGLLACVRVADSGDPSIADVLLRWARVRLGPSRAPRRIVVTEEPLPRTSTGKVVRSQVWEIILRNPADA